MIEIIDLSQEIYSGMPVFPGMPQVEVVVHATHEEWDGITDSDVVSPAVNRLAMGEHTATHVGAINHMARAFRGRSIDTMPLTMFYTEGICLDLSHKGLRELIEPADLEHALSGAGLQIKPGDTVFSSRVDWSFLFSNERSNDIASKREPWRAMGAFSPAMRLTSRHSWITQPRWRASLILAPSLPLSKARRHRVAWRSCARQQERNGFP